MDDFEARLREICMALPQAVEKPFGGHTNPAYRVNDKLFAMQTHYENGPCVVVKAPPGALDVLVNARPDRFYPPPYSAHQGWVGIRLSGDVDWDEIAGLVYESFRLIAPKRVVAQLDAAAG